MKPPSSHSVAAPHGGAQWLRGAGRQIAYRDTRGRGADRFIAMIHERLIR